MNDQTKIEEKITSLLRENINWELLVKNNNNNSYLNKKIKILSNQSLSWKIMEEEILFFKEILDSEMDERERKNIEKEIFEIEKRKKESLKIIEEILIEEEEKFENNCIIEIRSGAGGNEAKLFVKDIFQMYVKFSEKKKWEIEMMNSKIDSFGGFSFISFLVKGKESFKFLRNESGVHRVQRIPETENKGRIQTSTITVVVLPELNDIDVKIEDKDIKIDTYKSSGAGGQHVNTTDSAVRITHIPTGIFTTSQDGRSQNENKKYAILTLRSILHNKYKKEQENKIGIIRNDAIGNSDRSEKIRTYNFQQNRVVDHRIKFQTGNLDSFISGEIEDCCKKLLDYEKNFDTNIKIRFKKINLFIERLKNEKNF